MKIHAVFVSGFVVSLLLAACASPPANQAVTPSPASAGNAIALVQDGKLTDEGKRKRDAGLRLVASDRNAEAYAEWLPLALAGHSESQYNMGLMTRQGLGTPIDVPASLQWMRRAAAGDYPEAFLDLGTRYAKGTNGVDKDPAEAMRLFLRAAELGDATAAFYAGQRLFYGHEVEADKPRALALLTQAAQAETAKVQAQSMLGRVHLGEGGLKPDYAQARYWIEQAAAAEDSEAQFHLGVLYHYGRGVQKNLHKALGWYLRAAQQGYAPALNNIGILYKNGDGVRKNLNLARTHFERAHAKGSLDATINLGDMLFNGVGTPFERSKAVALYKLAAEADHAWGQCRYAQSLLAGEGVAQDAAEAAQWQEKARLAGIDCKPLVLARAPK